MLESVGRIQTCFFLGGGGLHHYCLFVINIVLKVPVRQQRKSLPRIVVSSLTFSSLFSFYVLCISLD